MKIGVCACKHSALWDVRTDKLFSYSAPKEGKFLLLRTVSRPLTAFLIWLLLLLFLSSSLQTIEKSLNIYWACNSLLYFLSCIPSSTFVLLLLCFSPCPCPPPTPAADYNTFTHFFTPSSLSLERFHFHCCQNAYLSPCSILLISCKNVQLLNAESPYPSPTQCCKPVGQMGWLAGWITGLCSDKLTLCTRLMSGGDVALSS